MPSDSQNSRFTVLMSTCPPEKAREIARELVEARLAACINIVDRVTSVYRWEGELCEDGESLLVMKTLAERVDALVERLVSIHPYSVPELVAIPVTSGTPKYLEWVEEETRP